MNSIIITTTNNVEGSEIKGYFTPISANMVIGANIFSDISASWTDFFGGRSDTYERKLQEMYEGILHRLKEQASDIGANCILGLKVDFGEISGKGNQMFMLSAVGTPVYIERGKDNISLATNIKSINGELLDSKVKANRIVREFFDGTQSIFYLPDATINFIIQSRLLEFSELVVTVIEKATTLQHVDYADKLEKISAYFKYIDKEEAIKLAYRILLSEKTENSGVSLVSRAIKEYGLIDYNKVLGLLKSPKMDARKLGLKILSYQKSSYSASDISLMKEFVLIIKESFPKTSQPTVKKGLLSSKKEAWLCACGKTNDLDSVYCGSCFMDEYGFISKQVHSNAVLNLLECKLEAIEGIQQKETV